jgi:hypothetical protein
MNSRISNIQSLVIVKNEMIHLLNHFNLSLVTAIEAKVQLQALNVPVPIGFYN